MITKDNWDKAKQEHQTYLDNAEMGVEVHNAMIDFINKKISECEDDPMPEDVKEVIKEVEDADRDKGNKD